jgi:hypothetical protein
LSLPKALRHLCFFEKNYPKNQTTRRMRAELFVGDLGVGLRVFVLGFYVSNGLGEPLLRELYFTFLFLNTFFIQVSTYRLDEQ